MTPFESYPGGGRTLLGPTPGANARHEYGVVLMRKTGQTCCAYCGMDFAARYENWLQLCVDHVVPRSVCGALAIPTEWYEDCTNKVLACSACNTFDNRFKHQESDICPASLEEFYALRDRIFTERNTRIGAKHRQEREFFERKVWEPKE